MIPFQAFNCILEKHFRFIFPFFSLSLSNSSFLFALFSRPYSSSLIVILYVSFRFIYFPISKKVYRTKDQHTKKEEERLIVLGMALKNNRCHLFLFSQWMELLRRRRWWLCLVGLYQFWRFLTIVLCFPLFSAASFPMKVGVSVDEH